MSVQQAVLMVNLTVAMANVFMAHGHVTAMVTVPMVLMKPTVVVQHVLMVNMTVVPMAVHMVSVSMAAGHVMAWLIAMMAVTKLTVAAAQSVKLVSMISQLTVLNVVIQQQMHLALTVLHWKVIMAGIALAVNAH